MNPEDAAAARFRLIAKARERIAKAEQAHAVAIARIEELRGEVGPAERRDRERLGEALVAGKSEPPAEAERLKAEVVRQEARVEALQDATALARAQIPKLVDANRAGWRRQVMREFGNEKQRYEAAISELQAAREALTDEATLITWLDRGELGEAANHALNFPRTIEELRADVEVLAAHPDKGPQPELQADIGRMRDGAVAASLWGGR